MNTQLKKGALDLCVLSLLEKGDKYGYELVSSISEVIHIAEGTMYPLLKRIKEEGYVTTYLKESTEGPPRKYYHLTKAGEKVTGMLKEEWKEFIAGVNLIIEGEKDDKK